MAISYVPLLAGGAWAFFATGHWPRPKGSLLGASGLLIGIAASSALFLPVLLALIPSRRLLGMSIGRYTYVGILVTVVLAAALAVWALAGPLR